MQNKAQDAEPFWKKASGKKAQGAIEYLLIIGAAILVVAIVIIAISGILNSATEDNSQGEYQDAYADLKYEHIGFPITINSGQHDSFTLAVQPTDNSLPTIFSNAPEGTKVTINYDTTYEKISNGWTPNAQNAKLNQGDIIDIDVPDTAITPLKVSLKGNYTRLPAKTASLVCPLEGGTLQTIITFEPSETNPQIIFNDLIKNTSENRQGSEVLVYKANGCYFRYYHTGTCTGTITPLCSTYTTQTVCSSKSPICLWLSDYCNTFRGCNDILIYQGTEETCTSFGCTYNGPFYNEETDCEEPPIISAGDTIELTCKQGQEININLVESKATPQKQETITVDSEGNLGSNLMLKNYSCYNIKKIYDKIVSTAITTPLAQNFMLYIECYRNNESVGRISTWNTRYPAYFELNSSTKIYSDTVCEVYGSGMIPGTITFNC